MTWDLSALLAELHDDIEKRLSAVRKLMGHPVAKGDGTESVWTELLTQYLPLRYQAARAFVVDSEGHFSQQIDVVVFDRQYSPFIFKFQGQTVIPAESVYAVFEAKQAINASEITYARDKIASVRALHRTSLPVPTVAGVTAPKPLPHIHGGLLTFESDWSPPLGESLRTTLQLETDGGRLDLGCVAAHGTFFLNSAGAYEIRHGGRPATSFLFALIAKLQASATVPMIDIQAYAQWLAK